MLSLNEVKYIYSTLAKLSLEERKNYIGLNPKRADVIVSGVIILLEVMETYNIDEITISSQGILEGFIEDYLLSL